MSLVRCRTMGCPHFTREGYGKGWRPRAADGTEGADGLYCWRCRRKQNQFEREGARMDAKRNAAEAAAAKAAEAKSKRPSERDIEGAMESILHVTKAHGADPQQYARAAGFALGYWNAKKMEPRDLEPEAPGRKRRHDVGSSAMMRAHETGYRVGRWLGELAAAAGSNLAIERMQPAKRKKRPRRSSAA